MSRAKYASKCDVCDGGISPGDEIRMRWGKAVHLSCGYQSREPQDQPDLPSVPRRRKLMDLISPPSSSGGSG